MYSMWSWWWLWRLPLSITVSVSPNSVVDWFIFVRGHPDCRFYVIIWAAGNYCLKETKNKKSAVFISVLYRHLMVDVFRKVCLLLYLLLNYFTNCCITLSFPCNYSKWMFFTQYCILFFYITTEWKENDSVDRSCFSEIRYKNNVS
jgi:hypothetical protein